jgi:hypothetical protein
MLCGFLHGFDCLDDYDDFDGHEGVKALFGEGTPASRTLGDFLSFIQILDFATVFNCVKVAQNRVLGQLSYLGRRFTMVRNNSKGKTLIQRALSGNFFGEERDSMSKSGQ